MYMALYILLGNYSQNQIVHPAFFSRREDIAPSVTKRKPRSFKRLDVWDESRVSFSRGTELMGD